MRKLTLNLVRGRTSLLAGTWVIAACAGPIARGQVSIDRPVMVKNITTTPSTQLERVQPLAGLDGFLLFTAYTAETGNELWKSDGTAAGTVQVKDINPGPADALVDAPQPTALFDGRLFFAATDATHGVGLWKTDGTESGTVRVSDAAPAGAWAQFATANGLLFFLKDGQLWQSDGNETGTLPVSGAPAGITMLAPAGGLLFFGGTNGLWKADGSEAGTSRISGVVPKQLAALGQAAYFTSTEGGGRSLWKSDGTEAGTVRLKQISTRNDSDTYGMVVAKQQLFFVSVDVPSQTWHLWRSDGTADGTFLLRSGGGMGQLTPVGDRLFLALSGGSGSSLWESDGSLAGTKRVPWGVGDLNSLIDVNGTLFFSGWLPSTGPALWTSEGASTGSVVVQTNLLAATPVSAGGALFFSALSTNGVALWKSDGRAAGTSPVKTIDPSLNDGSTIWSLWPAGGRVCFQVENEGPPEFWASDGTAEGTISFKAPALQPLEVNGATLVQEQVDSGDKARLWSLAPGSSKPQLLLDTFATVSGQPPVPFNRSALFWTRDSSGNSELWRTDGTVAGTVRAVTVDSSAGFVSWPQAVVPNPTGAATLFFLVEGSNGAPLSLWKSDGTIAGTLALKEFGRGNQVQELAASSGRLFFSVQPSSTANQPVELWTSDGTAEGTRRVNGIEYTGQILTSLGIGSDGTYQPVSFALDDRIFFVNHASENALWTSDGTDAGTILLKSSKADMELAAVFQGNLFFLVQNSNPTFFDLWKTDGTEAGTVLVKEKLDFMGAHASLGDGTLLFWNGTSLWRTDGTPMGTVPVKDFDMSPWAFYYGEPPLLRKDGATWFICVDATGGRGLWKTDGTESGTVRVTSLPFGDVKMAEVDGTLFFTADDGINGTELWKFGDRDTDGQGLPDWWQAKFFGHLNISPDSDSDGDGASNFAESRAGTDPTDAQSVLRLEAAESLGAGKVRLKWRSARNQQYQILRSSSLSSDPKSYRVVARRILGTPPLNSFIDSGPDGSAFYRVQLDSDGASTGR